MRTHLMLQDLPHNSCRFEGNRLLSFHSWPSEAKAYAFQLSRSGFYYSGNGEEVVCFACEGRVGDWQVSSLDCQVNTIG